MTKDRTDSAYLGGGVGDVTPPIPKGTGSISYQDTSTYNYNSPSVYYVLYKYNETLNLTIEEDKH